MENGDCLKVKTEEGCLSSSLENLDENDIFPLSQQAYCMFADGGTFDSLPQALDAGILLDDIHSSQENTQLNSFLAPDSYLNNPTSSSSYTGLQTMPPVNQVSDHSNYGRLVPADIPTPPPDNANWLGPYDFRVIFHPTEKSTKNISWTYSEMRDKLYVSLGMNCPIDFETSRAPPPGSTIKVSSVFIKPSHSLDVVRRCLNHMCPTEPSNMDSSVPVDHVIRCDSHIGLYSTDDHSAQRILDVNYTGPEAGKRTSTYLFKFMCWSSCVGGMNRRRIKVIFSLEDQGRCIGRRSVEVRVCACPGRDRRAEERHFAKKMSVETKSNASTNSDAPLLADLKRGIDSVKRDLSSPLPKKAKTSASGENGEYVIKVKDYQHYKILKIMKKALQEVKYGKKESSDEE